MAFSKAHLFKESIQHFSLMCKSMGHPARAEIVLKLIAQHGEKITAGELAKDMPIAKSTFSEHLKVLRDMSVVCCEVEHPFVYYSMNTSLMNTFTGIFSIATQAELKYDDTYKEELQKINSRRMIGAAPI